jgi:hypothetical protein
VDAVPSYASDRRLLVRVFNAVAAKVDSNNCATESFDKVDCARARTGRHIKDARDGPKVEEMPKPLGQLKPAGMK